MHGLTPLHHITLASTFFKMKSYPESGLYYFNSINCVSLIASAEDDREAPKCIWDLAHIEPIDTSIPNTLLGYFHIPPWSTMAELLDLGRRFVCHRCFDFGPVSWPELVRKQ